MIAQIQGTAVGATERFSGSARAARLMRQGDSERGGGAYRGARGLPKELIERIETMYGFDKPIGERFC
jgi:microcin C transport system permease protein